MPKVIMVQGTMSNAGKSIICAGLCRIFAQDGYRVAPFKSQNMALNSAVTADGLELGRAQVMQAEAAGMEPLVWMNPILLKPTDDEGSQIILNGKPSGNMSAREYFTYKPNLIPHVQEAFRNLSEIADIIVIEGAGSPAEINLRENDIVNMGLAEMLNAPVILAGDIDRGGVFAQLLGTLMLLTPEERARIKGLVINKFRGDASLLDPGIDMLETKGGVPVVGVVPYIDLRLQDEDSLTTRFDRKEAGLIDIAVVRLPRISNFTDLDTFERFPDVSVRYVSDPKDIGGADMIVIPGSKNTISDLIWMKESGFAVVITARASESVPVFGICGGYQMLGLSVDDPYGAEGGGRTDGLGLLPVRTVLAAEKKTERFTGKFGEDCGIFHALSGTDIEGYEIHMGRTEPANGIAERPVFTSGNTGMAADNVFGTYIHGVFDKGEIAEEIVKVLAERKGLSPDDLSGTEDGDYKEFREREYDKLAATLREHLDMDVIYGMLQEARI